MTVPADRRILLFDAASQGSHDSGVGSWRGSWSTALIEPANTDGALQSFIAATRLVTHHWVLPLLTLLVRKRTYLASGGRMWASELFEPDIWRVQYPGSADAVTDEEIGRTRRVMRQIETSKLEGVAFSTRQLLYGDSVPRGRRARALFEYCIGAESLLVGSDGELALRFALTAAELAELVEPGSRATWYERARVVYRRRSDYAHGRLVRPSDAELSWARDILIRALAAATQPDAATLFSGPRSLTDELILGTNRSALEAIRRTARLHPGSAFVQ